MIHLGDITKISGYTAPPVEVVIGGSYKIYKYTFPDGKVYIGMTKNSIQTRRDQGYSHNKPLQEALRTAGWKNVIVDILEEGLSHEIACEKERYYIHIMDADKPQYGYNVSKGGKSTFEGLKHTEAYRKKMSELNKGKVFSEETIQKIKTCHTKERKAVIQMSLCEKVLEKFDSLGDAALAVAGHKSNISRACKNGNIYKGFKWAFDEGRDDG